MRTQSRFLLSALALLGFACSGAPDPDTDPTSGEVSDPDAMLALSDGPSGEEQSRTTYEAGSIDELERTIAEREAAASDPDAQIQKSCLLPLGYDSEFTVAETEEGDWVTQHPFCDWAFCQDGTLAVRLALKSFRDEGDDFDDRAVTAVAIQCNEPDTGAFVHWAVAPGAPSWALGEWDNSGICVLGTQFSGANFKLVPGGTPGSWTTGQDDVGITDGAGICSNGTVQDVDVNNPSWGTWQGWENCPSGTRICGVTDKQDYGFDDDGYIDVQALTGTKFACCEI